MPTMQPAPALAPVYDMLPMMWRPSIHTGALDLTPVREPHVLAGYAHEYAVARTWAILFWQNAAQLEVLDDVMRDASLASATRVRELNFE